MLKKKNKYAEQTKERRNQRNKDTNKEKLKTKYEREQKCRYVARAERG